jgi:calcium-dependent protein kinase
MSPSFFHCIYSPSELLSGIFFAETEQGVAQAILRGNIDFKREPWPNVSENAKDLVRRMLEPDLKLRLTAKQVIGKSHLVPRKAVPNMLLGYFLYDSWNFQLFGLHQ